ncbi:hypothetical protein, partial [Streptomyces sp.]|uniref:hypothetical protein n=1 Tax=Streptomyces sp. TaxID=1931 RepID=UPI0028128E10
STNLALIFGTLLSSQGADASFVLTLSGFPPGASFVSSLADLISFSATRWSGLPGQGIRFRAFRFLGGVKHYQAFSGPLTTPRRADARRGVDHWG